MMLVLSAGSRKVASTADALSGQLRNEGSIETWQLSSSSIRGFRERPRDGPVRLSPF